MSERDYTVVFTARRWRWLPWPTDTFTFEKHTTWDDAYDIAMKGYESRAHRVSLFEGKPILEIDGQVEDGA